MLTALRSHTVRNIKINFSSRFKTDLSCGSKSQQAQQKQKEDSQYHFLNCQLLLTQLTWEKHKIIQGLNCDDSTTARQNLAVAGFTWLLDIREMLLEAATPASGATLVAAPSPWSNRGLPQNSVLRKICYYLNNKINEEKIYNYNQT